MAINIFPGFRTKIRLIFVLVGCQQLSFHVRRAAERLPDVSLQVFTYLNVKKLKLHILHSFFPSYTPSMQNQNQSWLGNTHFPGLVIGHVHLFRVLIGSLRCFGLLWLAIVIDTRMDAAPLT